MSYSCLYTASPIVTLHHANDSTYILSFFQTNFSFIIIKAEMCQFSTRQIYIWMLASVSAVVVGTNIMSPQGSLRQVMSVAKDWYLHIMIGSRLQDLQNC